MRTAEIDVTGPTWVYKPSRHKTEHHEKERIIYLGPRARAVLKPWLRPVLDEPLFSPREATAERQAEKRAARKTPVQPSQFDRRSDRPLKRPGRSYSVDSYRRAVAYGCKRADVPRWHPHQLRHNAGTWLRREFGLDAARAILGHSSPAVTEIYAEIDRDKARDIMESAG
jgi:integrase